MDKAVSTNYNAEDERSPAKTSPSFNIWTSLGGDVPKLGRM